MRYWDSSAILPLLLSEATSAAMLALVEQDPVILTWWGTRVECVSAVARLERQGLISGSDVKATLTRLGALSERWIEVPALNDVRTHAARLLRTQTLRAADALQLAAAIVAADGANASLPFVTFDKRLAEAAEREGFEVLSGG